MIDPQIESDASLDALLDAYRYGEVGRCVNSVTHDANNALGVILAYAELVGMDPAIGGEAARMLKEIITASRRASDQLGSLTGIARSAQAGKNASRLGAVVERAVAMRQYDAKRAGVAIEVDIPRDLPEVRIEIPAIERAVIYMLANAMDAVADRESKRISIRAEARDGYVTGYIVDSAESIPEGVANRMFEPFFTTKEGHHLGLGLTAAARAAKANDGTLTYEAGRGFCLAFPVPAEA